MTLLRVLAVALLACGPISGALAASLTDQPAGSLLTPASLPLSLKVCVVGAALGAAVERLRSGANTRKP